MNIEDVFGDLPSLETERLLLRKLTLDDALDVFAYESDPEVARFTTWEAHKTIDDSVGFLSRVIDLYNSRCMPREPSATSRSTRCCEQSG